MILAAATASLELPEIFRFTAIGDMTWFIRNPGKWKRPWAAGIRVPIEKNFLVVYFSNTWGTTSPDSLYGEPFHLINARYVMVF